MTANQILLIQADGKLPNLALMKLATHHKNDEVVLIRGIKIASRLFTPDIVYISCIFSENREAAIKLSKQFPHSNVHIGGSGVDISSHLPPEIERLMPDYDLFGCNYSMGFTSRGCVRACPFCVVPEKEGHIKAVADIYEFWDPRHKHIVLCDNNILALPEHFRYIADQISDENLTVDFNQGLDIRLLTSENVDILASLRIKPNLRFSWDNTKSESAVLRGVQLLRDAGIKRSQFFVLSGFDSTFEDDLYRLNRLKQEGQRAYLMRYNTVRGKREYNDLAAWANQPAFFSKMTFQEFQTARANA